ncbi:heavy metal translocating P-type ATPase [Alcaligenaceae bacterium]|nr:heavy metal translocating P-type ATPase [Alcaligenaceae bacterium]
MSQHPMQHPAIQAGQNNSSHDHVHEPAHAHEKGRCCDSEHVMQKTQLASLAPVQSIGSGVRTPIRIMQMDCPTEEALIRKKLAGMSGVLNVQFNLMQRVLTVDHTPEVLDDIVKAIVSLDFTPELPEPGDNLNQTLESPTKSWWPLAIGGVAALGSEILSWMGYSEWIVIALALLAVLISGLTTYKKGWLAIMNGNLNINALMSIAVTGALALQHWPEAAMVMVLFAIAEAIEARSLDHARRSVERLMDVAPATVTMQAKDGSWQTRAAAQVQVGDLLRAKPGERIGLDGVVEKGYTAMDQSPITGESAPVDKAPGDILYAGSINGMAEVEYRVQAEFSNTMLARIIHAVHDAQASKAPTQRFVDQFSRVYTPIVCVLAVLIAVIPPLMGMGAWTDWIYKALVLLVIACPCALVISTPVAVVSGLAAAAKHGILIKGGAYLEQGRKLVWLAVDKTGTLTTGKPVLHSVELGNTQETMAHCQRLAASLAARSDHPVSQAIAYAWQQQLANDTSATAYYPLQDFQAIAGAGSSAFMDGVEYRLGSPRWLADLLEQDASLSAAVSLAQSQGQTVSLLANPDRILAAFVVADTIRPSSAEAIAQLHQLGIRTVMLSGDNQATARHMGQQAGIDDVKADLLPQDKLEAIAQYAVDGAVGMVGDGINDAPALARADIGFAMGAVGTDTAIETADVALMDDDLRKIPRFIRLSRSTHAVLVQNITLALGIKAVFLVVTLMGLATMWMAVFADVGASLIVILNSLRLLRK